MKKRDLLFASLMLIAAPAFAQDAPDFETQDGKTIFFQGFEADWDTWSTETVDQINQISYYKKKGADGNSYNIYDGSGDWEIFAVKDTILKLTNGVMLSDDKGDSVTFPITNTGNKYREDVYTIREDSKGEVREALKEYGVDAGSKFFEFTSGKCYTAENQWGSYYQGKVARYRRNLFVRLKEGDIKPNTSYRLTLYVKAKKISTKAHTVAPTFYADVMRGHFHSEKPFSMGIKDDADNHQYKAPFQYTKDDFDGSWEKVTFMTYYLNDSIANQFVMVDGYWWTNDWKWYVSKSEKKAFDFSTKSYEEAVAEGEEGDLDSLSFTVQPNKFFVRLSFSSDSTQFQVDNISLAQSTIGGVEHYKDMVRVDFGYKTNLTQLAKDAYARTNIAAVELPGKWFTVWGQDSSTMAWKKIEIASAEYHDDGYMYMWTKPEDAGRGRTRAVNFDKYNKVLVSFINPDVDTLQLKYTGTGKSDAEVFPNALDIDWIKAGKKVFDFNLEESTLNPNIGKGVYSMKNLPPVVQGVSIEDGSFNLPGDTKSITLKLSRLIAYEENAGQSTKLALLIVSKAGSAAKEYWPVSEADETSATFTRPASYSGDLLGDYEFKFVQLKGEATEYGADKTYNYSFGDPEPTDRFVVDLATVFANTLQARIPKGITLNINGTKYEGDGEKNYGNQWGQDCSMQLLNEGSCAPAGFYLSSRTGDSKNGPTKEAGIMEYGTVSGYRVTLESEKEYNIKFGVAGWDEVRDVDGYVYFNIYDLSDNSKTPVFKDSIKAEYAALNGNKDLAECTWYEGKFTPSKSANYVMQWISHQGYYSGSIILAPTISYKGKFSDAVIGAYNIAVANAQAAAKFAESDANKYEGTIYSDLAKVIAEKSNFVSTAPSKYAAVTKEFEDATAAQIERVAVVDALYEALELAQTKYFDFTEGAQAELSDVKETVDLGEAIKAIEAISCKDFTSDDIKAKTTDLTNATYAPMFVARAREVEPVQVKALISLADDLGISFAENKDVQDRIENLCSDDQELAAILKQAIKVAIYEANATEISADTIDLTSFIQNYIMYAAPIFDEDMEYYYYQWGTPNDRWRTKNGHESTTVFPGWIYKSTGGNSHVGSENDDWRLTDKYPVFDAYIGMDWSTTVVMTQQVVGLPAGNYQLGVGCNIGDDAGNEMCTLSANEISKKIAKNGEGSAPSKANVFIDSISISNDTLNIKFEHASGNYWARLDNWALSFVPSEDFNYAEAVAAEKTALDELITFVDASSAAVKVEYYGLDGKKMIAPKAGQVSIRKSIMSNGKSTVEKILK